ncbi:MAG: stage V sporulation T C-terminal domain-containing protein [bacterium]
MKNIGVTRRIDELGRIVIPKEIRRMLSIRDGETLEIMAQDDLIILKKYNYIKNIAELGEQISDIYKSFGSNDILITDREKVVICTNDIDLINKPIDPFLMNLIDNRECSNDNVKLSFGDIVVDMCYVAVPIINDTDCIGLVIIFNSSNVLLEEEIKLAKMIAKILADKINIS